MQISARNQIEVTIVGIEDGAVNDVLLLETAQGMGLSASITDTSVKKMELKVGESVIAFFKASNVLIAKGTPTISARNRLEGSISEIKMGAVNAEITIVTNSGNWITSIITNDAVSDLGLKNGDKVVAIIKASEVMIAK